MKLTYVFSTLLLFVASCGTDDTAKFADHSPQAQALSPDDIATIKQQIIDIAQANTRNTDNLDEVRAQLDPLVEQLKSDFVVNRPDDELTMQQGTWKSLWFDNKKMDPGHGITLKRNKVYQVIEEDYFANVAEVRAEVSPGNYTSAEAFLRGDYSIINPATPELIASGTDRLNVLSFKIHEARSRRGKLPKADEIEDLTIRVFEGDGADTSRLQGFHDIRGEIWNVYLDDTLRIALGNNVNSPEEDDMYVLIRPTP